MFRSWRRKLQEAGIVDISRHSTMTVTVNKVNLIFKCFFCDRLFLFGREMSFDLVWKWREV